MKRLVLPALLLAGIITPLVPLPALGRSEGSIQKTWDFPAGLTTLVVDADEQDIVIKAGGPRITGRVIGTNSDDVRTAQEDQTLTITVRADRSWFAWRHRTSRVELSVPPGLSLDLTTASGAILVKVTTGSLRARAASGDIEAPQGGQAADVDTASGTVRLKGFTGPVKAAALSGDLRLEDLSGTILANTLSGDIEGDGLDPADGSRFTAASGDVRLRLRSGTQPFTLRTETVSGRLTLGDEQGERKLEVGRGDRSIVLKTVSGDIRVR